MDLLLTCKDQSQADQPNSLAEGPPYKSKSHPVVTIDICGCRLPLLKESFLKECLRLCVYLLLQALNLFLSLLVITVSLILRSMHS